jgi:hypothetical protein
MYPFVDFMSQNGWVEGVLYINLLSLLVSNLKNSLLLLSIYYYIYIIFIIILMLKSTYLS